MMEINKIYLGDAYELIKQVPDKSVDLIVTDPPYQLEGNKSHGMASQAYDEIGEENLSTGIDLSILGEFVRVLKKINVYIWCNKEQIYDYLTYFVKERGCNFEILVWAKIDPIPFCGGHYLKDKEYCLYFWEAGAICKPTFDTARTVYVSRKNVADKKDYGHPTIKPEAIIENLIRNSCGGGLVLDPFVGSGTTCLAAKRLGMNYIGFEINPKYHQIAVDRLEGVTKAERESGYVQERLF